MRRRDFLAGAAGLACGLCRAATISAPWRGLWRDAEGRSLAVGRFPEFGPGDFLFNYAERRVGPLAAGGEVRTVSSTLDGNGAPAGEAVREESTLLLNRRRHQAVEVRRVPFEAHSEGISLSAELALPDGSPKALVLLVYGSGAAPKEAFDLWALWFLAVGYAVVTYDKRGSGRSGGDWRLAGLETLAADARAVLEGARARLGASAPVFAWGASQAGWILPQLAVAGVIDGMLLHAPSAMTPGEQMLMAVEAELRVWGFPDEEIARARAYYALDTDVSRGRRPWSDIESAYQAASAAEWIVSPPAPAAAPERVFMRLIADFDPATWWGENDRPVLALFGGKDLVVPAAPNRARFDRIVRDGEDFAAITLPSANHLMFEAQRGVRSEYGSLSRLVPGYFEAMSDWLAART